MKQTKTIFTVAMASATLFLTSCSGGTKEVLIMGSGTLTVGENSVTIEPGTRHNEKKLRVTADKITVKGFEGVTEIPVANAGLYVLNLKKDTIVGSYQRVGEGTGETKITRDVLRQRVDSLSQLMVGSNVNATSRNFFLAPGQAVKISDNGNAQVIGPYLTMPTTFEGGKEHEIYKFYTNKEMREIVDKLKPMVTVDSTATE
ncbi:MAG: hypothetical protein EOO04_04055 [Chitinophagaceae bacterium]|nr:MAG: hypothetical protein EOO04_04055 [Chitinophagaceae bacterium]